jgi:hypothetical protein
MYGYDVEAVMSEARRWIPDDATWEDIEDYVGDWEEGVDIEVYTVSPGSQGIYQVKDAAEEFGVEITPEDEEYDGGWEAVEEKAQEISDGLTDEATARGLPGDFFFGHNEADGSYGLRYAVRFSDLPNVAIPASESRFYYS